MGPGPLEGTDHLVDGHSDDLHLVQGAGPEPSLGGDEVGAHLHGVPTHDGRGHEVDGRGVGAGDYQPEVHGVARRRPLALHGDDGVHDVQPDLAPDALVEVDEEAAEPLRAVRCLPVMVGLRPPLL